MPPINPIEAAYRRLTAAGRPVVKLFSGNPLDNGIVFPPEVLRREYERYFAAQDYRPHPKGDPAARAAVAGFYAARGLAVDAEHIVMTSGTSESFLQLFLLLGEPGDNVLAPAPAYPLFEHLAGMARLQLKHYPLDEARGWAVDLEALRHATDARTRAVLLVSPNNPTGAVVTAEEARAIAEWCNTRDLALLTDEVFSDFYFGAGAYPRPAAVARPRLAFTLNGISKRFALPALKLGWIAITGEPERVAAAADRLETLNDTLLAAHTPVQRALPSLFREGETFVAGYREEVRRRRDLALELLARAPRCSVQPPAGGFYLTVAVDDPRQRSEEGFVIALLEETGVFVHPGYFFDYERGIHLVISFLTEPETLRRGLERLVTFVGG